MTADTIVTEIRQDIADLDIPTRPRLSDLMRYGSARTDQSFNWGHDGQACALSAAALAYEAWQGPTP